MNVSKTWKVSISNEAVMELASCFSLVDSSETFDIDGMIKRGVLAGSQTSEYEEVVARLGGIRVEIMSNEHPPPHFHVYTSELSACFDICTCKKTKGDLGKYERAVKKWHKEHLQLLINTWNKKRPTDCPVGDVNCKSREE